MSEKNNESKKSWKINVNNEDKIEFTYPSKIEYIDVETLCRKINALMRSMFQDANGSYLEIVQNQNGGGFSVFPFIYFSEPLPGADKSLPRAFVQAAYEEYQSVGMQANNNARNQNRTRIYSMTEAARNIFTENFIYNDGKVTYDPNQFTTEEPVTQVFGGAPVTTVRVKAFGIDMRLLIELIVKDIKPDDVVFFTPAATVPSSNPNISNFSNTLLKIEVVSSSAFAKIGEKYHIGQIQNISTNAGPIVTM